jgi:uncharacterized membrane protein
VKQTFWGRWRTNFVTGLVLILPAVVTLALLKWLFGTTTRLTNMLLFPVPKEWKYINGVNGEIHWFWGLATLAIAAFLVALVGLLGRYYVGKKIIAAFDSLMLRVPLLNKIYGTMKQVNEAFSSDRGSSFQTVVLLEFPRKGLYSLGFITSEQNEEVQARTREKVVSVFVPTTPNPTSGFLVMASEKDLTKLEMPVADGIRFIISLGSVAPKYNPGPLQLSPEAAAQLAAPTAPTAAPPASGSSDPSP